MSPDLAAAATPIRRRSTETRALIVDAATECLRHRRVRDLRVEEVMETAGPGLSRTLFYRHFDDLVALVLSIAAPAFDQLFDEEELLRAPAASMEEGLQQAFKAIVGIFVEHGPIIRAALDAASFSPAAEDVVAGYFEKGFDFATRVLSGFGVPHPEEAARALVHMDVAYLTDSFGGTPRVSPEQAAETLVGIWFARCTLATTS